MRAVVQRAREAGVRVDGRLVGAIQGGLVVFLGVAAGDQMKAAQAMAAKLAALRVFEDERGRMNRNIKQAGGAILLVPQFTVIGDVRRGNRPSFHRAAAKAEGEALFRYVKHLLEEQGLSVPTGVFGARMQVDVQNDGPVTILLDTERQV